MDAIVRIPGVDGPLRISLHDTHCDEISERIRTEGVWEAFETQLFTRLLEPGDCVIDVGANIGYYSLLAACLVGPAGSVWAFEPEAENFAKLRENLERLSRPPSLRLFRAACSARSGEAQLFLAPENRGDHRLAPDAEPRAHENVPTLRLDDLMAELPRSPDLVKIDTQGGEVGVLQGMARLLDRRSERMALLIELWPYGIERAGASPEALVAKSRMREFEAFAIFERDDILHPVEPAEVIAWTRSMLAPPTRRFANLLLLPRTRRGERLRERLPAPPSYACAPGALLELRSGGNARGHMLAPGWSFPETWGTWTDGEWALLRLGLPEGPPGRLRLRVHAYADERRPLPVELWVNGQVVARRSFTDADPTDWCAPLPVAGGVATVALRLGDPRSPREMEGRPDARRLGLGVHSLAIEAA